MLIRIDPALSTPLYEQLASGIRASIIDGRQSLDLNVHTVLRAYHRLRDERLIELHRGRGAVVAVRIGGHAALAGAIHDLVDEAKSHDVSEGALVALIHEAFQWTPQATGVQRPMPTR